MRRRIVRLVEDREVVRRGIGLDTEKTIRPQPRQYHRIMNNPISNINEILKIMINEMINGVEVEVFNLLKPMKITISSI